MEFIKAIIVDDEINAQKTLEAAIERDCKDIRIIAKADSVMSAVNAIDKLEPDLVFLDMELPDGIGFDIIKTVSYKSFVTIFVTAFDQFSIQAFKFSAVDYLLKPVDSKELYNAVERAKIYRNAYIQKVDQYEVLFENISSKTLKKFAIPTSEGLEFINIDEVILIKADGSYSEILFINGKRKIVSKVLKEFQERLYGHGFFRSHNSFLVNLIHVKKLLKRDGGSIEMTDGTIAGLSKKNVEVFKQLMNNF
jgi:two-component system, LytTR family, response regulator